MSGNELKVSPGLEDRLLEYAADAEAFRERGASEALGLTALLANPEAFVTDMKEAAALVAAVRDILERPGSGAWRGDIKAL
jgi:hypothetical protein